MVGVEVILALKLRGWRQDEAVGVAGMVGVDGVVGAEVAW